MKSNTRDRVLRVIKSDPQHGWTAPEIAGKIDQKTTNVAYHLKTMTKEGMITKVGPGQYSWLRSKAAPAPVVNTAVAETISAETIIAALWSELLGVPVDNETVAVLNRVQTVVTNTVNN